MNGTYLRHFGLFFGHSLALWGVVTVFCRLVMSLRSPTMAMRFAVTVGLRASAPSYGNPALAAVSGLSKCHSVLTFI